MTRSARARALLATLAVVGLAGCSSDTELSSLSRAFDLRHDDPLGFTACRDVGLAELADDGTERTKLLDAAAAQAAVSESGPLRGTVSPSVVGRQRERISADRERYSVEAGALYAACEEMGFDFTVLRND